MTDPLPFGVCVCVYTPIDTVRLELLHGCGVVHICPTITVMDCISWFCEPLQERLIRFVVLAE